jgi:hypothetical protein
MRKMLIYTFSYRLVQLINGPLPCMKVLQLVFISLFSGLTRGNGQTYCSWVNWEAKQLTMVFFVWTYCSSLRGFETPNVLLHDLRQQIVDPEKAKSMTLSGNKTLPHISLPLEGRFKARSHEIQRRIIDIAWETSSGLKPGLWAMHIIDTLEKCGIRDGWVFQRNGKQMRMSEFGPYFFDMLLEIQKDPNLIHPDIDILQDFGLARSERRGATTRSQIAKLPKDIIDWVNRWNIGEGDVVHGPMRVVYSERKQMMETFLEFSLAL